MFDINNLSIIELSLLSEGLAKPKINMLQNQNYFLGAQNIFLLTVINNLQTTIQTKNEKINELKNVIKNTVRFFDNKLIMIENELNRQIYGNERLRSIYNRVRIDEQKTAIEKLKDKINILVSSSILEDQYRENTERQLKKELRKKTILIRDMEYYISSIEQRYEKLDDSYSYLSKQINKTLIEDQNKKIRVSNRDVTSFTDLDTMEQLADYFNDELQRGSFTFEEYQNALYVNRNSVLNLFKEGKKINPVRYITKDNINFLLVNTGNNAFGFTTLKIGNSKYDIRIINNKNAAIVGRSRFK